MRRELLVQVVEREDVFDFITSVIAPLLGGASVLHHESGDEAREWLFDNTPDLLFCDWESGGAQLLRELRGREAGRLTPVVTTSASMGDRMIADAVRGGASAVLGKPFNERELRDAVQRITSHLEQRRSPRVLPSTRRMVQAELGDGSRQSLELVDLSLRGCRLRTPSHLSKYFPVGACLPLSLEHEGEILCLEGELLRQEYDPEHREGGLLLLAFAFKAVGHGAQDSREWLQRLLAEL